jgi:hypothetical protein
LRGFQFVLSGVKNLDLNTWCWTDLIPASRAIVWLIVAAPDREFKKSAEQNRASLVGADVERILIIVHAPQPSPSQIKEVSEQLVHSSKVILIRMRQRDPRQVTDFRR